MRLLPALLGLHLTLPAFVVGASRPNFGRADDQPQPAGGLRPNIVFILCDDLGFGATGPTFQNERRAKGDRSLPAFSTPRLDRFAREGMQLRNHYAAAPLCAPARASLPRGVTQGHCGVRNGQFDKALANNHTLATVLKRAGYARAAIGKWGLQGQITVSSDGGAELLLHDARVVDDDFSHRRACFRNDPPHPRMASVPAPLPSCWRRAPARLPPWSEFGQAAAGAGLLSGDGPSGVNMRSPHTIVIPRGRRAGRLLQVACAVRS